MIVLDLSIFIFLIVLILISVTLICNHDNETIITSIVGDLLLIICTINSTINDRILSMITYIVNTTTIIRILVIVLASTLIILEC